MRVKIHSQATHSGPALAQLQAAKFPHLLFTLPGVFLANSQATSTGMCNELGVLKPVYAWGLGREVLGPRDSLPHV